MDLDAFSDEQLARMLKEPPCEGCSIDFDQCCALPVRRTSKDIDRMFDEIRVAGHKAIDDAIRRTYNVMLAVMVAVAIITSVVVAVVKYL